MYNTLYNFVKTARTAGRTTYTTYDADGNMHVGYANNEIDPIMDLDDTAYDVVTDYRYGSKNAYLNAIDNKYKPTLGVYLDRYKGALAGTAIAGGVLGLTKDPFISLGAGILGGGLVHATLPAYTANERHRRIANNNMLSQDCDAIDALIASKKFEKDVLEAAKKVDLIGEDAAYRGVYRNAPNYGIRRDYTRHKF